MATFTPNLSLELQGGGERASLVVLNENLTRIDTFAGNVSGKTNNIKIDKVYGVSSATAINVDSISEPNGYIVRIQTDGGYVTGTLPTSIISGNAMLIYGFSYVQSGGSYGVQVAMGFGSDTLAIRKKYYGESSWDAWKPVSANALVKNDVTGVAQTNDLNSITTTSLLTYGGDTPNAPTANGGVVFTLTNANGSQRAQFARPNNQSFFAVRFNSGNWSDWGNLALNSAAYIELLHTTTLTNGTGELCIYRIGKMVHIDFTVTGITNNTIIGYVPSGYGVSQRGCFGALATTDGKAGWLYTTSDRRLSVLIPNLTTSESVVGACSYYIG